MFYTKIWDDIGERYTCYVSDINGENSRTIEEVKGIHHGSKTNKDVEGFEYSGDPLRFFDSWIPKNIGEIFPNQTITADD